MRAGARDTSLGPQNVCFLFYLFEYSNAYCQLSGMHVRPRPPLSSFHHTTALGIYFYLILLS